MAAFTREEIARHNREGDLWIAIDGRVYDVSHFGSQYPGGLHTLTQPGVAGRDAAELVFSVHGPGKLREFAHLQIGVVAPEQALCARSQAFHDTEDAQQLPPLWRRVQQAEHQLQQQIPAAEGCPVHSTPHCHTAHTWSGSPAHAARRHRLSHGSPRHGAGPLRCSSTGDLTGPLRMFGPLPSGVRPQPDCHPKPSCHLHTTCHPEACCQPTWKQVQQLELQVQHLESHMRKAADEAMSQLQFLEADLSSKQRRMDELQQQVFEKGDRVKELERQANEREEILRQVRERENNSSVREHVLLLTVSRLETEKEDLTTAHHADLAVRDGKHAQEKAVHQAQLAQRDSTHSQDRADLLAVHQAQLTERDSVHSRDRADLLAAHQAQLTERDSVHSRVQISDKQDYAELERRARAQAEEAQAREAALRRQVAEQDFRHASALAELQRQLLEREAEVVRHKAAMRSFAQSLRQVPQQAQDTLPTNVRVAIEIAGTFVPDQR